MNRERIEHQLKEIYELEKFQLSYYMSQLSSTEDKFYHIAFTKIVQTEKKHATFFAKKLTEMGMEIPKVRGTLADFAGIVVGESLELTGPANACKIGVALENKTLKAYQGLKNEVGVDSELLEKLLEFQLDEEFHALWLQSYSERLKMWDSQKSTLPSTDIEEHPTVNINMRWI